MNNKKPKSKYPLGYNYAQNVDTSDMPDNIHYFLVLPLSASKAKLQKYYKSTVPIILTYQNDDMTFSQLLDQFKRQNSAYRNKNIAFTTQKYTNINHGQSVKSYKSLVGNKNINGMILCIYSVGQQKEQQMLPFYLNECSMNLYNKKMLKQNKLNLRCQIPIKDPYVIVHKDGKKQTKYQQRKAYIFVVIPLAASGLDLKNQLIKKLNLEFQKDLKIEQIASIDIDRKVKLDEKQTLNAQSITSDSHIALFLLDNQIKLTKKKNVNCKRQLIIFKEGETDPQPFQYEQVWDWTFQQLYQLHLKLKGAEQKIDSLYCLKVMQQIIQPNETINKLDCLIKQLEETTPAIFVGKVINQKMLFYKMIPQISLNKPFSVNQLTIPQQHQPKRQQLRSIVRQKAKSARHAPLKSQQNLEPIMLYTSNLRYIDQQDQQKVVYASLNGFLRNSKVLSLQSKDYEADWRFRYCSILLRQLEHIQRFKGKVYRGLTYDPKVSVGNILTFKQFTSTSKQYERAKFFADQNQRQERIIYEIETLSGFPIKEYSYFAYEDEVLLQPFTDFLVNKIEIRNTANSKYKVYHLRQIPTPKQFPIVCANFIVWIDNSVDEGRKIFEHLAYSQTTLLIQLKSTKELKKWLEDHKDLLNDKTANIMLLTNMTRKQENVLDEYAGANAIKELRKYTQRVPICVYIGNLPLAKRKLAQSNINIANILVTADSNQVTCFLLDQLVGQKK